MSETTILFAIRRTFLRNKYTKPTFINAQIVLNDGNRYNKQLGNRSKRSRQDFTDRSVDLAPRQTTLPRRPKSYNFRGIFLNYILHNYTNAFLKYNFFTSLPRQTFYRYRIYTVDLFIRWKYEQTGLSITKQSLVILMIFQESLNIMV